MHMKELPDLGNSKISFNPAAATLSHKIPTSYQNSGVNNGTSTAVQDTINKLNSVSMKVRNSIVNMN